MNIRIPFGACSFRWPRVAAARLCSLRADLALEGAAWHDPATGLARTGCDRKRLCAGTDGE